MGDVVPRFGTARHITGGTAQFVIEAADTSV
jgi:hypothetical protein